MTFYSTPDFVNLVSICTCAPGTLSQIPQSIQNMLYLRNMGIVLSKGEMTTKYY